MSDPYITLFVYLFLCSHLWRSVLSLIGDEVKSNINCVCVCLPFMVLFCWFITSYIKDNERVFENCERRGSHLNKVYDEFRSSLATDSPLEVSLNGQVYFSLI